MAFFDKLNQIAKSATDIANEAIDSGKGMAKIKKEQYNIAEQYKKIGQYYYQQRTAGMTLAPEVEEFCVAVDLSKATIAELEEQMREAKTAQPDETDEVPCADVDVPVFEECSCPKCGAAVAADALFCGKCGEKLN